MSSNNGIASLTSTKNSCNRCFTPHVYDASVAKATYLYSVDDIDTVVCFSLYQATVDPNVLITKRVCDFLVFGSDPKSTYVSSGFFECSVSNNDSSPVVYKYCSTYFVYFHNSSVGCVVYLAKIETAA